ncbi:MAG: SOS response-associated peptidase [Nitrosospira sp.]
MCGRISQLRVRQYYAQRISPYQIDDLRWTGGDRIPQYNVPPGSNLRILHMLSGKLDMDDVKWGYRTPREAEEKKKPWINERVEIALTGRYFRHMFSEGRVIVPAEGWYEWTVENGKKQPWYITRKLDEPMFMAALTNWKPFTQQPVETGVVIVTQDSIGGMVDIHDRRPVVLEPADAWRWMDQQTPVEEAAHIAQSRSLPTEEYVWWRVDRAVNTPNPNNNGKHLLVPIAA